MKRAGLILPIALLLFGAANFAHADVFKYATGGSAATTTANGAPTCYGYVLLASTTSPYTFNLSSVRFYWLAPPDSSGVSAGEVEVRLNGTDIGDARYGDANWISLGSNLYSWDLSAGGYTVNAGDSVQFLTLENSNQYVQIGSQYSGSYAPPSGCGLTADGTASQTYFALYGAPVPTDYVSIVSPAASSTGTPSNFILNYSTAANPAGDPYQIQVWTGTDLAFPHLSASGFFPAYYSTSTATATLPVQIGFSPDTTYFEYAVINRWYDANTFQQVASSSPQYFNTTYTATVSPSSTIYVAPTSTITTSTPIQITCDPNDAFFQYSLCNLGLALFVPSPDALNSFQGLINQIKTKPPIGYFTIIATDLSEFNASSSETIVILAPSIVSAFGGAFGLFDEYLGIAVVLLFMWWLFHRFRHFEL